MNSRVILAKHEGGHLPVLVDEADYARLNKYSWRVNSDGYALRTSYNTVLMHREVMNILGGPEMVDHINTDKLDNRSSNLRCCTKAENNCNLRVRSSNRTGYKGVFKMPHLKTNPYRASITHRKRTHFLGYFPTAEQASDAYDAAATLYHGAFAYLNRSPT